MENEQEEDSDSTDENELLAQKLEEEMKVIVERIQRVEKEAVIILGPTGAGKTTMSLILSSQEGMYSVF